MKSALTLSVRHAVKEDPVPAARSVLDKGHVVAGLDAEDGEQLQFVSGQGVGDAVAHVTLRNVQESGLMGAALGMRVYLRREGPVGGRDYDLVKGGSSRGGGEGDGGEEGRRGGG